MSERLCNGSWRHEEPLADRTHQEPERVCSSMKLRSHSMINRRGLIRMNTRLPGQKNPFYEFYQPCGNTQECCVLWPLKVSWIFSTVCVKCKSALWVFLKATWPPLWTVSSCRTLSVLHSFTSCNEFWAANRKWRKLVHAQNIRHDKLNTTVWLDGFSASIVLLNGCRDVETQTESTAPESTNPEVKGHPHRTNQTMRWASGSWIDQVQLTDKICGWR